MQTQVRRRGGVGWGRTSNMGRRGGREERGKEIFGGGRGCVHCRTIVCYVLSPSSPARSLHRIVSYTYGSLGNSSSCTAACTTNSIELCGSPSDGTANNVYFAQSTSCPSPNITTPHLELVRNLTMSWKCYVYALIRCICGMMSMCICCCFSCFCSCSVSLPVHFLPRVVWSHMISSTLVPLRCRVGHVVMRWVHIIS